MKLTIAEVVKATNGRLLTGDENMVIERVTQDSRKAGSGDLFFAIIGERFDGHTFVKGASEGGCKAFLVSRENMVEELMDEGVNAAQDGLAIICVEDTVKAMADLARYRLSIMNIEIIGVTGSTGKTSTKDMVACVMASKYKTGMTKGNFNNELGLPLTVFDFADDLEVGVLEMGMDHKGEIDYLCNIAHPKIGLITNIGISHMENLGSREGIFHAKMEITDYFTEENTLIVEQGEDFLRKGNIEGCYESVITGFEDDCDYVIKNIKEKGVFGIDFELVHGGEAVAFSLPVPGLHMAKNAALAVAAGEKLGISMEEASQALKNLDMTGGRLAVKDVHGITVIDDTYNASPDSMKAAVEVLATSGEQKRYAVLGDMLELGSASVNGHKSVGEKALEKGIDGVYCYGQLSKDIAEAAGAIGHHFDDKDALLAELIKVIKAGDVVLFKGSRGMKMESVIEALENTEPTWL